MNKVLIIDDEPPLLKIMADQFTSHGLQAITAQNGAEGLKIALQNHPDVIILDIKMPVMDGIAMIEQLRQDTWGSEVAVMILSNMGDADSVTNSMKNKVMNYYVKSDWKLDDIVRRVKDAIAQEKLAN